MRFSTLTLAAAFSQLSIAGYVLEDDYMTDFYGGFEFFTAPDPTEGFVKYVDENTARQSNLINTSMTAGASWGVDFQNQTPQGRPSVRITSKKSYDSGLIVLDVAHMPVGCGTWPAFWTTGPNWPHNGEIDIIEGVNDQVNNAMTLHTGPGCQIGSDKSLFEGSVTTGNCYVKAKGQKDNAGCSIEDPSSKSYGAGLNANGGGVFATQWTSDAISVYFFPRDSVPADVLGDNPDPSSWGKPSASFQGGCDIGNTFKKQQIVFDTTFCGVWAGNPSVWQKSSCSKKAATCEEWVKNNPEAFAEAYWTVNSLKVYQDNGQASPPKPSSAPQQSSAGYVPEPIPTQSPVSTQSSIPTQPSVPTQSPVASPPKPSFPPQQSNPAYGPMPVPTQMPQGRPSFPGPPADAVQSTSLIVPSVSGIFAPIPTSETLSAPVASPPADQAASSPPAETPSPTTTQGGADPAAPSPDVGAPAPAPVGAGGMRGFQWPKGAGGGSNDSEPTTAPVASPPQNTGAPTQAPSSGAATPSATQSLAQPSNPPAVPEVPAPAPAPTGVANAPVAAPVVPVVTDIVQSIQIVYETVYATVTASAPAATTPPAAKNRRMARFIREHRQRLTRHHAKF